MPTTVVENTLADVAKSELPKSGEIKQDQTVAVPAKSDKQSVAASAADANLASLPKGAGLSLKFRQNSWIQVKAENGTILSSHLAKAGTEESFELKQALSVKIGNAAGVDATLRGAAFPIIGERGSNVANLVVK
jgi:cytoskeleton protein RodZ